MDDPIVEELDVELCERSRLCLWSFPTRSDGVVSGVATRAMDDSKQSLMSLRLIDCPIPFVASPVNADAFFVGVVSSDGVLRLSPFGTAAIVAPNLGGDEEWTAVPHRMASSVDLVVKQASAAAVGSGAGGVVDAPVDLGRKVAELFSRAALATWTDVCNLCNGGSSSDQLLLETVRVARLVRGVFVRRCWGGDEAVWRSLLSAFVASETLDRSAFLASVPARANVAQAKSMLEAIAWRVKSAQGSKRWVLKAAPDLRLLAEFPDARWLEDDQNDGVGGVKSNSIAEASAVQPVQPLVGAGPHFAVRPDAMLVMSLFEKNGLLSDAVFQAWIFENNMSKEAVQSLCEKQVDRNVWSLRRDVLNQREECLGDYVFAALRVLCRAPLGALLAKKDFFEAFRESGLAEANDTMYKKAVRTVAVAEKTKWRLKPGEIHK